MDTTARLIDALQTRGSTVRQAGNSWQAQCPAHNDRNPSLSISRGREGVVLHCHAGCTSSDVLAALGMTARDLYDDPRGVTEREVVYPYRDEHGTIVFEVVRRPGKQFTQRRPGGGNVRDLPDPVRHIPFRLPELAAAMASAEQTGSSAAVFVVEGEKDALALAGRGYTATCNAGGAGNWRLDHTRWLVGADVHIVADRDEPGLKHANDIAKSLAALGTTARIVLPAVGKDISDHLNAGLTVHDLVPLGDEPEQAPAHPLADWEIDWADFWQQDPAGEEWLIEPLIARGRSHSLYAEAKAGKSWLLLAGIAAACSGRTFLTHHPADPITVLYVDYEMGPDDLRDRLEEFSYGPDDDLSRLHYIQLPTLPPLDTPEGGQTLLAAAQAVGADLVVIDTTSRTISGDENDSGTILAFNRHTGLVLKQHGIALVRLDHAGKDVQKGQRGTSAKNDDVDVVWQLTRTEKDGVRTATFKATHRRMSWVPQAVHVNVIEDENGIRFVHSNRAGYPPGTSDLAKLLDDLGVPLKAGRTTANNAIKAYTLATTKVATGKRGVDIDAAQRARREAAKAARQDAQQAVENLLENVVPGSGQDVGHEPCPDDGTPTPETAPDQARTTSGHVGTPGSGQVCPEVPPYRGDTGTDPVPQPLRPDLDHEEF